MRIHRMQKDILSFYLFYHVDHLFSIWFIIFWGFLRVIYHQGYAKSGDWRFQKSGRVLSWT